MVTYILLPLAELIRTYIGARIHHSYMALFNERRPTTRQHWISDSALARLYYACGTVKCVNSAKCVNAAKCVKKSTINVSIPLNVSNQR